MQRPHQLSGNGTPMIRFGSDGMIKSGTTGDHPSTDSPLKDGPGIRDTGITTDGYSSTSKDTGIDSRQENGLNTQEQLILTQHHQEVNQFVDHSSCLRSGDSQLPLEPRLSQDAKSELVKVPNGTCGKTEETVDSSVVN